MGLVLYIIFLSVYGALIHRYGYRLGADHTPAYFLYVLVFLWSLAPYPYLILSVMVTGWVSDLFHQHPWASDSAFYTATYLLMDRLELCKIQKQVWVYWPTLMGLTVGYHFWNMWLYHDRILSTLLDQCLSDAWMSLVMFFLFKQIRLGWGLRARSESMPVLNA
jgi:hypothetical protein